MSSLNPVDDYTRVMEDILDGYTKKKRENQEKREAIERTILKRKKLLEKMDREEKSWIDAVLRPLADIIAEKLGAKLGKDLPLPYEFYGPFGLSCETTVYWFPTDGRNICDDETYSLTVYPEGNMIQQFWLEYDTGKRENLYAPGTLGEVNGMNKIRERLPNRLGEIMELVRHHAERRESK